MSQETPLLRRLLLPGLALILVLLGYRSGWTVPMFFGVLYLGLFVLGEIVGGRGWRRTAWVRRFNHYSQRLTPETAAQSRDELLALRAGGDHAPELLILLSLAHRLLGDRDSAQQYAGQAITALQAADITPASRSKAHRDLAVLAEIFQADAWTVQGRFTAAAEQLARRATNSPYPPDFHFALAAWNYHLAGDTASTQIMLDNMLAHLDTLWDRRKQPFGHANNLLMTAYLRHTLRGEDMRDDLRRYRDQLASWDQISEIFAGTVYGTRLREVLDDLRAVLDTL